MRKTNKKGFTIVELVVVVAVIAILAAVLIPTFSGIIKKANIATDQKAVAEINKQIAMVEAESGELSGYGDAKTKLLANGIDISNYKPLAKGYTFYYDNLLNQVLYVKDHKTAEFPKDATDIDITSTAAVDLGRWNSLSGEIGAIPDSIDNIISNGTVRISTAAQFVKFANDYLGGETNGVSKVVLVNNIDLKGASVNFGKIQNLEFDGNDKILYGAQVVKQAYNKADDQYAFGIFGSVNVGGNFNIHNLTIDGAFVNGIDHSGILVGNVTGGGKLTATDVTIKNSYVRGMASVGAITGYVSASSLVSLTDVTVSNVTVVGGRGVAKLVGEVQGTPITLSNVTAQDVTVAQDTSFGFESAENASVTFTEDGTSKTRPGWTTKDYWDKDIPEAKNF